MPAEKKATILLVEDHEDSAEMMTLFLESEGYRVRWASTAQQAVEVFRKNGSPDERPDVILLDLTLPDVDGTEVGPLLRQVTNDVPPIIIMSAKSAQAVQSAAETMGAAGFVRKPFATDKLLASIASALNP